MTAEVDYQAMMMHHQEVARFADLEQEFIPLCESIRRFTMTSIERMYDLYKSVEYLVYADIPGDILECGVWRGGSMMMAAKTILKCGDDGKRKLWLYDTFEGHDEPPADERDIFGVLAIEDFRRREPGQWAKVELREVLQNMLSTGYDPDRMMFVKGKVENTADGHPKEPLALIRLDTDWYPSAAKALAAFWPRLSPGGILIVDDYGHYEGQRRAVDEYFDREDIAVKMTRIDYACRTIQKGPA